MRKVSLRLPPEVVAAYDDADGTRSAVMRRRLIEAVDDGEVTGVSDDLKTLVERERAVDTGRLERKRGKFRQRCYDYFRDCWDGGAVTPDDAEALARSWLREATIYGPKYVAFVEAITDWYGEEWEAMNRTQFPEPGVFVAESDPDAVDARARLVDVLSQAEQEGVERADAVQKFSDEYPTATVFDAAAEVFDGDDRQVADGE